MWGTRDNETVAQLHWTSSPPPWEGRRLPGLVRRRRCTSTAICRELQHVFVMWTIRHTEFFTANRDRAGAHLRANGNADCTLQRARHSRLKTEDWLPMDPDIPIEAQDIVRAYMLVLEHQYRTNDTFPMPLSTLPYPKPIIRRSMQTTVASLSATGQLTSELQDALEIAYTSLADYLDDELVQVMREYNAAMAALDSDQRIGREKTSTAAWGTISATSSLVARIAQAASEEADTLRAEFRAFRPQTAAAASTST